MFFAGALLENLLRLFIFPLLQQRVAYLYSDFEDRLPLLTFSEVLFGLPKVVLEVFQVAKLFLKEGVVGVFARLLVRVLCLGVELLLNEEIPKGNEL